MPKALDQNLKIMGEQIMLARKRRHLSMQDVADRATVTRLTVSMRACSMRLIWKTTLPCLLPTTLLADNFRMQNYLDNEKNNSLRRF